MRKPRYSLRFILAATAASAFAFIGFVWYSDYVSSGARYQRERLYGDLSDALANEIHPGMTYSQVAGIIGPGELMPPGYIDRFLKWQKIGKWPDGYFQPGDRVVEYRSEAKIVHGLEIRNGKLINYDPSQYSTPRKNIVSMNPE